VRLIRTSDEVRHHAQAIVSLLDLTEDDEIGRQRVADLEEIAERPIGAQHGGVADHGEPPVGRQPDDGRVGQILREPIELGLAGLVVEERHGDADWTEG